MMFSTPGKHSVWCNSCEYPRFCTSSKSLDADHVNTVMTSQNAGTNPVPFNYDADVVPLRLMPTLTKLLNDCLSLVGDRKTIYLQGSGCEHANNVHCDCSGDDVLTNCIYVNMCVTYSMAMYLRDALRNRGITLVVECISCGKTQLCPEIAVNALDTYDEVSVSLADYSVNIGESERVSFEYVG
nr:MAG: VP5B [Eriocheir sinensis reovirus 1]